MCYYITPTIWEELLTLGEVLLYGIPGPPGAAGATAVDACVDTASAAVAARLVCASRLSSTVFVKGYRRCWEEVMTGGVMTFDEVVDGIIIHHQHVSNCLHDHWLLPINLSVYDNQFLKFLNLAGFFLHGKVHWLIPTSLTSISALMEFYTTLRVCLYINMLLCYTMQSKHSNGIELQSERAITRVIIVGGAKVEKEGATLVLGYTWPRKKTHATFLSLKSNFVLMLMT